MQRRLDPEAEIVMMTYPMQKPPTRTSPLRLGIKAFMPTYVLLSLTPIVFYFATVMAKERESKFRQTLEASGMSPALFFLSWLVLYATVCLWSGTFAYPRMTTISGVEAGLP